MEEVDNPFRKAGIALLIIGVVDMGVMAYCIANKINYSSSFNIFAVIAGIFLIKRGVKTARVVRWFSTFLVVAFIGLFLLTPFTSPISLLIVQFTQNILSTIGLLALTVTLISVLIWVRRQLSTPEALNLLSQAGYKTTKPKTAYFAAGFLLIVFVGVSTLFLNGESAQKAKALAQEQLGSNYKYHVSSLSVSGESGHAIVTAYTKSEIRNVEVRW